MKENGYKVDDHVPKHIPKMEEYAAEDSLHD